MEEVWSKEQVIEATSKPPKPSRVQVENLKQQWLVDGTWDIEDTPGFEAHRWELRAFREEQEERRDGQARERRVEYQESVPDHVADAIIREGRPIEKLALANAYHAREMLEVQKRIASALEKATEVKPWEK